MNLTKIMKTLCNLALFYIFITISVESGFCSQDKELDAIIAPWGLEKQNQDAVQTAARLVEFFACESEWRLKKEDDGLVATRRFRINGRWELGESGRMYSRALAHDSSVDSHSIAMKIFINGSPNFDNWHDLGHTNRSIRPFPDLTILTATNGMSYGRFCATTYLGVTLFVAEQSKLPTKQVLTNAVNYLVKTVSNACFYSGSYIPSISSDQKQSRLEIEKNYDDGQYYARAMVQIEAPSVCYLRIKDDAGEDVVSQSFMFAASNELLGECKTSVLYDAAFTLYEAQANFRDEEDYRLELVCRILSNGAERILATQRMSFQKAIAP